MPRMQVYLPDDLYQAVKERGLPASELLQGAVKAEIRRQEILAQTDRYLDELVEEVGEPSPGARRKGERMVREIVDRASGSRAS